MITSVSLRNESKLRRKLEIFRHCSDSDRCPCKWCVVKEFNWADPMQCMCSSLFIDDQRVGGEREECVISIHILDEQWSLRYIISTLFIRALDFKRVFINFYKMTKKMSVSVA